MVLSFAKPPEDTVIAALRAKKELKELLYNTVQELPMTLDGIKIKAEKDDFIIKMKKQVKQKEKNKTFSVFSIYDEILMYMNRVVMPFSLQKRGFEGV